MILKKHFSTVILGAKQSIKIYAFRKQQLEIWANLAGNILINLFLVHHNSCSRCVELQATVDCDFSMMFKGSIIACYGEYRVTKDAGVLIQSRTHCRYE